MPIDALPSSVAHTAREVNEVETVCSCVVGCELTNSVPAARLTRLARADSNENLRVVFS